MPGCSACYFKGWCPFHQDEFGRGQPPLVRRSHHLFIPLADRHPVIVVGGGGSGSGSGSSSSNTGVRRSSIRSQSSHGGSSRCGCRLTSPGSWRRFCSRDSWKPKVPAHESRGNDYPRRISRKAARWYFLVLRIHRGIRLGLPFTQRRRLTNDTARTVWTISRYMPPQTTEACNSRPPPQCSNWLFALSLVSRSVRICPAGGQTIAPKGLGSMPRQASSPFSTNP